MLPQRRLGASLHSVIVSSTVGLTEVVVRDLMTQMVHALDYLHQLGIIYVVRNKNTLPLSSCIGQESQAQKLINRFLLA